MKILIVGGAGFIGSNLTLHLLDNNFEVSILDNFSNSSKEKIKHLTDRNCKIITGDIVDYDFLKNKVKDYDIVIHLAAKIDVEESIQNPSETFLVNVDGTKNLLRACVSNKVRNFIVASTAAVYGEPKSLPLSENSPLFPISPYGESKLMMEKIVQEYSKSYNLNSIILRFFNIYGPGQNDAYAGVITKFLNNILKNEPLTIFGDGNNTRDFIHISDVVTSIEKAITHLDGKRGDKYNIASGKYVTINELANYMLNLSKKQLEIQHINPREGDIIHSQPTIEKAKNELNFSPQVNLSDGLSSFLQ